MGGVNEEVHAALCIYKIGKLFRANLENTSCFLGVAYPPNRFVEKSAHECKHSSPFFDKSAWL